MVCVWGFARGYPFIPVHWLLSVYTIYTDRDSIYTPFRFKPNLSVYYILYRNLISYWTIFTKTVWIQTEPMSTYNPKVDIQWRHTMIGFSFDHHLLLLLLLLLFRSLTLYYHPPKINKKEKKKKSPIHPATPSKTSGALDTLPPRMAGSGRLQCRRRTREVGSECLCFVELCLFWYILQGTFLGIVNWDYCF